MNNWNQMFISEGNELRQAIRNADKSHSNETYIAVCESLIKLLNAALDKTSDDEECRKIKKVREHVSIGYSNLENADSLAQVKETINKCLDETFDLFDELKYWIGI
jgi:hypothetical protein